MGTITQALFTKDLVAFNVLTYYDLMFQWSQRSASGCSPVAAVTQWTVPWTPLWTARSIWLARQDEWLAPRCTLLLQTSRLRTRRLPKAARHLVDGRNPVKWRLWWKITKPLFNLWQSHQRIGLHVTLKSIVRKPPLYRLPEEWITLRLRRRKTMKLLYKQFIRYCW